MRHIVIRHLVTLLAAALLAAGCSKSPVAVPRRTAYPRPAEIDTAMTAAPGALPVHFAVNAAATATSPRPGWLDVAYPMYGAVAHITFTTTSADSLGIVQANRLERASLNTGGLPTKKQEWLNAAGFDILTLHTDGCATPFQFLATDGRRTVVSGAVRFSAPRATAATDSIAPMLAAIEADMVRSLNSLR